MARAVVMEPAVEKAGVKVAAEVVVAMEPAEAAVVADRLPRGVLISAPTGSTFLAGNPPAIPARAFPYAAGAPVEPAAAAVVEKPKLVAAMALLAAAEKLKVAAAMVLLAVAAAAKLVVTTMVVAAARAVITTTAVSGR